MLAGSGTPEGWTRSAVLPADHEKVERGEAPLLLWPEKTQLPGVLSKPVKCSKPVPDMVRKLLFWLAIVRALRSNVSLFYRITGASTLTAVISG